MQFIFILTLKSFHQWIISRLRAVAVLAHVTYSLVIWLPIVFEFSYGFTYEGWNFNSGNYLFTTDTK